MKFTGIEQALEDFKQWRLARPLDSANIMIDLSTGEVWTDLLTAQR